VDRMSPQDAMFLHVEDAKNAMHIGGVSVFEGPAPRYGDLLRAIAAKLALVPRYRQKARMVPLGLGRPVWVDDPDFQLIYHVRQTALPAPGGRDELRNLAGRIFGQLLDRTKPLWEMWLVEGLERGRWALISKVHHAMVDGVSATDLLTVLLDTTSQPAPVASGHWAPGSEPTGLRLVGDALVDSVVDPLTRLRGLPALARLPLRAGGSIGDVVRLAAGLRPWTARSAKSLNGPIGVHRRWSWAEVELADVKVIRESLGGTVNDVVLATVTSGFRDLLLSRGEEVEGTVVRTLVPVSMRSEQERGRFNNRVAGFLANLPVGIADPVARLADVRDQMEVLKESGQAMAGDALTRLSGFAPPTLLALGARLMARTPQRIVQTVATNVPGPRIPLFMLSRRLLYSYPYVPVMGSVRISVGIFSYGGLLAYGITGDYDSVTDIDVLRSGIEAGATELLAAAGHPRGNGRARRKVPGKRAAVKRAAVKKAQPAAPRR
jgi:diacylglycerol O-acyltransferase / wax synthase